MRHTGWNVVSIYFPNPPLKESMENIPKDKVTSKARKDGGLVVNNGRTPFRSLCHELSELVRNQGLLLVQRRDLPRGEEAAVLDWTVLLMRKCW